MRAIPGCRPGLPGFEHDQAATSLVAPLLFDHFVKYFLMRPELIESAELAALITDYVVVLHEVAGVGHAALDLAVDKGVLFGREEFKGAWKGFHVGLGFGLGENELLVQDFEVIVKGVVLTRYSHCESVLHRLSCNACCVDPRETIRLLPGSSHARIFLSPPCTKPLRTPQPNQLGSWSPRK